MTLSALLSCVALGTVVFVSTNIDDIVLLAVFFADDRMHPRAIVLGQFTAMAALVFASAAAAMACLVVPAGWIGFLGVFPLALGLRQLPTLWRPSTSGEQALRNQEIDAERRTHLQTLSVAAVTLANGSDNLGVYIPLFAKQPSAVPAYAILFAALTAAWCALGFFLANNPLLGKYTRRYGRLALPFVLIGLGIYILSGVRLS